MTVSKTTTQEKARQYCLDKGYSSIGSESVGPWIAEFADSLTAELQKENARLREALEELLKTAEKFGIFTNHVEAAEVAATIALTKSRAALSKEKAK